MLDIVFFSMKFRNVKNFSMLHSEEVVELGLEYMWCDSRTYMTIHCSTVRFVTEKSYGKLKKMQE